ncbi:MAG: asparagine synthase (glutamine-hydrolyzing) [Candidatus Neomarinimicrobiota bacterium]
MCGITGIVDIQGRPINEELVRQMTALLKHRGPDEEGIYRNEACQSTSSTNGCSVALGNRRLKVIDLEGGGQPLCNEQETIWITFNGEIYNYRELREELISRGYRFRTKSDTEVIVYAYEEYGPDCVHKFRGMFAFALWDERQQRLMLARDRLGKKPLVYALTDRQLIFASELRAILQHPAIERVPDYEAIHHYLTFWSIPAPWTAFRGVRKLPPANYLLYDASGCVLNQYWQLDVVNKLRITREEAIEEITSLLDESVKLRLNSDVPLGIFLSGGVDSSAIVAIASEQGKLPIKTFSIGFDESEFNELPHARRVAEQFNTKHFERLVKPDAAAVLPRLIEYYGEPFADSSALPTYYLAQMARQHVTVALNGDGGDEIFGGYYRHAAMQLVEIYHGIPSWIRQVLIKPASQIWPEQLSVKYLGLNINPKRFLRMADLPRAKRWERWTRLFSEASKRFLYTQDMNQNTRGVNSVDQLRNLFASLESVDGADAGIAVDTMLNLPSDLLVKMDIATMAHGLEARSPFLDHHLVEFVAGLPGQMKVRGMKSKVLLKDILRRYFPREHLNRTKQGFTVPLAAWLRGSLKDWMTDILSSSQATNRGVFRSHRVQDLVDSHLAGTEDHAHKLWALIVLEIWFDRFIDQNVP